MERAELTGDACPDREHASQADTSRWREALELAGVGVWELDPTTDHQTWSDAIFRIFELPRSAAGPTVADFLRRVHPEDRQRTSTSIRSAIARGERFAIEYRLRMADGRVKWVHARGHTHCDSRGQPTRTIGTVQEISQRVLRARAFAEALGALATSPALAAGDLPAFAQELTEAATAAAGVERANVWLFEGNGTALRCVDGFTASSGEHSAGMCLSESQFANEFAELRAAPYVNADDALSDPRTAGYIDSYLKPLGITAMLDAVISESGQQLGLVCLEHVGGTHHWEQDEIDFACRLGDKIGLAVSNHRTRQAHDMLQEPVKELQCIAQVTELLQDTDADWEDLLQRLIRLLPPAMQHPDAASARIAADGTAMTTPGWSDTPWRLRQGILVDGQVTGQIEVGYDREYPERDDGPFLREEVDLLALVALKIGQAWSRRRVEATVRRLGRIRAMTSTINNVLLRALDRDTLFADSCRIAVEQGGFLAASVVTGDAGDRLHTLAGFGKPAGDAAPIATTGVQTQDPRLRCLREQRPIVVDPVPSADHPAEAASSGGHGGSTAVLPLHCRESTIACLQLCAGEAGFFDDDEMALLGEMAANISFALDVIAQRQQIDFLALHDPLTHLANRSLFTDRLGIALQAAAERGYQVAVLLLDVARFRPINEALGYAAGDEVLRAVAQRLCAVAENPEHVARIGGDQFALILPQVRRASAVASFVHERLSKALGRDLTVTGVALHPSARIGIALFPEDGADADTLFRNAEAALKQTKRSGENYLFFRREMQRSVRARLNAEGRLFDAIRQDALALYYQPKIDLSGGRICGAEALLRWKAGEDSGINGESLIAMLTDMGRIAEIGLWALKRAVADRRQWAEAGLHPPAIAVNIPPSQLLGPDFVGDVAALLGGSAGGGAALELEVTESGLIEDVDAAVKALQSLRELGVPVAIDDFGTGYSSLSYLARLPVRALKIDRSFVEQMMQSSNARSIVTAVISLARSLQLQVIAEGVENVQQLHALYRLGCDQAQGFLFSPAVPAERFAEFLRSPPQWPAAH